MSTITKYALLYKSDIGTVIDPSDVDNYIVYGTEQEAAAEAGIRSAYPGPVVKITIETPDPPLPTTVGSVIKCYVDEEEVTFALDKDGDWYALSGYHQGDFIINSDMDNVKVLFDAATVKED